MTPKEVVDQLRKDYASDEELDKLTIPEIAAMVEDEEDFLSGVTCNPDAPEECESCQ